MISIHDLREKKRKNYYGSSKKVYRKCDLDYILKAYLDLVYLTELHTRTRLVPCNEKFLKEKAIPSYNNALIRMKEKYPNIIEFNRFKRIEQLISSLEESV